MASTSTNLTTDQMVHLIVGVTPPKKARVNTKTNSSIPLAASSEDNAVSPRRFYGGKSFRFMREAIDFVETEKRAIRSLTVIPPDEGSLPSDGEDETEQSAGLPRETAGELEVDIDGSDDEEIQSQPVPKLIRSHGKGVGKGKKPAVKRNASSKKKASSDKTMWAKLEDVFEPLMTDGQIDGFRKVEELEGKSYFEVWRKLFTLEMRDGLFDQLHIYAHQVKGNLDLQVLLYELEQFLGILLFSGYHSVPSERDFWSTQPDLQVPFIATLMARNRFLKIKENFHVADNSNLEASKVAKVKPLYDAFNRNLKQFGILHEKMSIDESMVPYKGLHSIRQYIKSKPIKFGYKIWALCGEDGYPYHLEIYCGKSERKFQVRARRRRCPSDDKRSVSDGRSRCG